MDNLLQEKSFEDFVSLMFEFIHCCYDSDYKEDPSVLIMLKTCIHFYSLLSIDTIYSQNNQIDNQVAKSSNEVKTPLLSRISSFDSIVENEVTPEVSRTFSHMRRSREMDFDALITDLLRKYQENISDMITEDISDEEEFGFIKELFIICKKLPCALDFSTKDTLLR